MPLGAIAESAHLGSRDQPAVARVALGGQLSLAIPPAQRIDAHPQRRGRLTQRKVRVHCANLHGDAGHCAAADFLHTRAAVVIGSSRGQ